MHKDEIEIVTIKEVKFYDSEDVDKSILDWAGYPILLSPKVMKEEYRTEFQNDAYQMVYCIGGNGSYHDHMGTGVFFSEVDIEMGSVKWNRGSVLGVPTRDAMAQWMSEHAEMIKSPTIKRVFTEFVKDPNWKPGKSE